MEQGIPNRGEEEHWGTRDESGTGRSLEIISLISRQGRAMTGPEVAMATGMSRATVYRALEQLLQAGWLSAEGRPLRFNVTLRVAQLGLWALRPDRTHRVALSYAISCARESGERCSTAVYHDGYVLYLQGITATPQKVEVYPLGRHYPALSRATGKVILAFNPEAHVMDALRKHEQRGLAPSLDPTAVADDILAARRSGYMLDPWRGHDAAALAVPVFDHTGHAVAAISMRLSDAGLAPDLVHRMVQTARAFAQAASNELGFVSSMVFEGNW